MASFQEEDEEEDDDTPGAADPSPTPTPTSTSSSDEGEVEESSEELAATDIDESCVSVEGARRFIYTSWSNQRSKTEESNVIPH